jgi:hypothetical protein
LLQAAPVQRSIKYWLIVPPVSVDAVQVKLICELLITVAARFVGAVGTGGARVLVVAVLEYGPVTFDVSEARTR